MTLMGKAGNREQGMGNDGERRTDKRRADRRNAAALLRNAGWKSLSASFRSPFPVAYFPFFLRFGQIGMFITS
jgi:hypothetical protein